MLGKYHPHGDAAVYDALVDGQGKCGSVDGDPPAAMRHTEARLSRLASTLLADIDRDTVNFRPNYAPLLENERHKPGLPTNQPSGLVNPTAFIRPIMMPARV